MGILGMLFSGPAERHEECWEPFSHTEEPAEDYCAAEWKEVIMRAKRMGVNVQFTTEGLKMKCGRSEGTFRDYRGGVKLAEEFLEEIA